MAIMVDDSAISRRWNFKDSLSMFLRQTAKFKLWQFVFSSLDSNVKIFVSAVNSSWRHFSIFARFS